MKTQRCSVDKPHKRHDWRPAWWLRKVRCYGVELDPWVRANPSIGCISLPNNLELPEAPKKIHKHKLVFSGITYQNDQPHSKMAKLRFTCECVDYKWDFVKVERWKWEEITGVAKKVDQSWPE